MRASYASAPPEFVEEARRADPFNSNLPRLSLAEIAEEFLKLAEGGVKKVGEGIEKQAGLQVKVRGVPRAKGNKIEINKPQVGQGPE